MPYGRGGAGNIIGVEQRCTRAFVDLEANQQELRTDRRNPVPPGHMQREEQQYAHVGRGGMGNYCRPHQLSERGYFNDANRSHILGDGTQPPGETSIHSSKAGLPSGNTDQSSTDSTRRIGRGGAGNMAFAVTADEELGARKRMHQQQVQDKLRADIERRVRDSLAIPEKAKLPGIEPF